MGLEGAGMEHDITEELREVREELRRLKAELVALGRVVEESILFQTVVALDTSGERCERAASVARILRMVADMKTRQ
jgi:hypothetical protein